MIYKRHQTFGSYYLSRWSIQRQQQHPSAEISRCQIPTSEGKMTKMKLTQTQITHKQAFLRHVKDCRAIRGTLGKIIGCQIPKDDDAAVKCVNWQAKVWKWGTGSRQFHTWNMWALLAVWGRVMRKGYWRWWSAMAFDNVNSLGQCSLIHAVWGSRRLQVFSSWHIFY